MPTKNPNKAIISAFLAKQPDTFKKKTEDQAYAAFIKADKKHSVIRPIAFRDYFRHYIKGWNPNVLISDSDLPVLEVKDVKLVSFSPGVDKKLDRNLFTAYKTGSGVDRLLSDEGEGGIMPGTSIVVVGDGGVGKSTVCYAVMAQLQKNYPNLKVRCIQSEMKRIDLEWEALKKAWMADTEFIVLKDYGYENIKPVLQKVFTSGFDILLIDSFEDVISKMKEFSMMTEGQAEQFLLGLMDDFNEAKNNNGIYGACIAIQQVTKGGVFKGSNKLKHATTAMMMLKFDAKDDRYGVFVKNRRGGKYVGKPMYYSLDASNNVVWDKAAFDTALVQAQIIKDEKLRLAEKSKGFDSFFGTGANQSEIMSLAGGEEDDEEENDEN